MNEEIPSSKVAHDMAAKVVGSLLAAGARVFTVQPDVMGGVTVAMSTKHRYADIGCPNEGGWVSLFKVRRVKGSRRICEDAEMSVDEIAAEMVAFMREGSPR